MDKKIFTLSVSEQDYIKIKRAAYSKGLKAASLMRLIILDSIKSKSYKDIEVPDSIIHTQRAKKGYA